MNNLSIIQAQSKFITKVYAWMAFGLLITGLVAYFTASSPSMLYLIFANRFVFYGLLLSKILLVFGLNSMIHRISSDGAKVAFIIYSALTGLVLSSIFFIYTFSSIAAIFFITSIMFATMAIYGHFTQTDLTTLGNALKMCLLGLFISSIVNLFLQNSSFDFILSAFGVIVFTLFTAYDAQKIKELLNMSSNYEDSTKLSIIGALMLYLDFINLFLYMLRFMGRKK